MGLLNTKFLTGVESLLLISEFQVEYTGKLTTKQLLSTPWATTAPTTKRT